MSQNMEKSLRQKTAKQIVVLAPCEPNEQIILRRNNLD